MPPVVLIIEPRKEVAAALESTIAGSIAGGIPRTDSVFLSHSAGFRAIWRPVIAAFVHRRFGDEKRLSPAENLKHAMLLSSLFIDVMTPIGLLIWLDAAYAGVDVPAAAKRSLERVNAQMHNIERTLIEWQWFAHMGDRPIMVADCLLWEELSVLRHVFGPHVPLGSWPELARFSTEFACWSFAIAAAK